MNFKVFIAGVSIAIAAASAAHAADDFLIQLDDTAPSGVVVGNTYQNGVLIQSVPFSGDGIVSPYGLWNGATLNATFDNQFNYYDPDGTTLSDTIEVYGTAGDTFFNIVFKSSDFGGGISALADGGHFIEDGTFQPAVYPGTVSNGDFYNIQMASFDSHDGGVPEPATWAMMLMGFFGLGATLRRRQGLVAA